MATADAVRARQVTPPTSTSQATSLVTPTSSRSHAANMFTPRHLTTPKYTLGASPLAKRIAFDDTPASMRIANSVTSTPLTFRKSQPSFESPESKWSDLTADDISTYDVEQLRGKLTDANAIISELAQSLYEARTSAAHFNLQHQLLAIQTHEAQQRHEVENAMAEREIEVLRRGPTGHTSLDATTVLENEVQRRRLRKARKFVAELQEELDETKADNDRLRKRVRDLAVGKKEGKTPATPKRRPSKKANTTKDSEVEDKLKTLGFLASQVLSQEMDESTVPNTPNTPDMQTHNRPEPTTPTPVRIPRTPTRQKGGNSRSLMSPLSLFPDKSPGIASAPSVSMSPSTPRQMLGKRKARASPPMESR